MQQNVGSADKVVRVIIGLVLVSLVFFLNGSIRWLGLIGLVPIFTAFVGWCPAYSLFGLSTSAKKH
ncbi:MAG: DUF2892 domain-containing protein [Gammaproteobacteria bacterium]|nr:DUF2892 domain-containing protein [Gammaproteobacteria bacterium]